MRAPTFKPAVLALLLAACTGGDGDGGEAPKGTPRAYDSADSGVTVSPAPGGFTAQRIVTLTNDDGGATAAAVSLGTSVGSITSLASSGGYQIQVTLQADGSTEQQAREALATLSVVHRDALDGRTLYLDNAVRFAPYARGNANRRASVTAGLPASLRYRLAQHAGVGSVSSSALAGSHAELRTGTGDASLSGSWDSAEVDSNVGSLSINGDIAALQAATSVGSVTATLSDVRNTRAVLDTHTGSIDVTLGHPAGAGFDLIGSTDVGAVLIAVAGTSAVGPQSDRHAHYRTPGYAGSSPRISIVGRTSTGDVMIHE